MDRRQDAGDARWLSYDEIAALRGIDRASAIRMVRRKHWAKQDANDGTTRVASPGNSSEPSGQKRMPLDKMSPGSPRLSWGSPRSMTTTITLYSVRCPVMWLRYASN